MYKKLGTYFLFVGLAYILLVLGWQAFPNSYDPEKEILQEYLHPAKQTKTASQAASKKENISKLNLKSKSKTQSISKSRPVIKIKPKIIHPGAPLTTSICAPGEKYQIKFNDQIKTSNLKKDGCTYASFGIPSKAKVGSLVLITYQNTQGKQIKRYLRVKEHKDL